MKFVIIYFICSFYFINFAFSSSEDISLEKWELYICPEQGFEVEFPGQPTKTNVNGCNFFQCSDITGFYVIQVSEDDRLNSLRNSKGVKEYIKNYDPTLDLKETNLNHLSNYLSFSYKFKMDDTQWQDQTEIYPEGLVIVNGNKFYNLLCATPSFQNEKCNKFFSSFSFLIKDQIFGSWKVSQFKGGEIAFPEEPTHKAVGLNERYICPLDYSTLIFEILTVPSLGNDKIDAYLLDFFKKIIEAYSLDNVEFKHESLLGRPALAFNADWTYKEPLEKMSGSVVINNDNVFYMIYAYKNDFYDESILETFKSTFKLID